MKKFLFISSLFTPGIALAATFNNITELLNFFTNLISKSVIPLLIALSVMYFMWGASTFIRSADDASKRAEGRQFMIYGIIALFVLISFWGLVAVLSNTFGVNNVIPQYKTGVGSADCVALYGEKGCADRNSTGTQF